MIVSRGLARESTSIPRIFNRPEIVIITVQPSNDVIRSDGEIAIPAVQIHSNRIVH